MEEYLDIESLYFKGSFIYEKIFMDMHLIKQAFCFQVGKTPECLSKKLLLERLFNTSWSLFSYVP